MFFKYNDKCYESCEKEWINKLCQEEVGEYRRLFKTSQLTQFIHHAIGDVLIGNEKATNDQLNYLTLQNGLYEIEGGRLIGHTPEIFTTNLLPYDYDPSAQCPRFLQFLEEIFLGDTEKINFIQESVGYIFHKSMPTPSMFFLIGTGSNGKSVLINTIASLVGKDNTSNISLDRLSHEYYLLDLFQKMINISGETPSKGQLNTSLIKSVTAGDWVTGRRPYKPTIKFRPYAKHFLAMNKAPIINDTSHGMWRRIWAIEFPRVFSESEMDRNLETTLSNELSGIFNWALEGLRRLKVNHFKFTESQSMKLTRQHYRNAVNSVGAFATKCLRRSENSDDEIKLSDLYESYRFFCRDEWMKCESKIAFRRILDDLGFVTHNSTRHANQLYMPNAIAVNTNNN